MESIINYKSHAFYSLYVESYLKLHNIIHLKQ